MIKRLRFFITIALVAIMLLVQSAIPVLANSGLNEGTGFIEVWHTSYSSKVLGNGDIEITVDDSEWGRRINTIETVDVKDFNIDFSIPVLQPGEVMTVSFVTGESGVHFTEVPSLVFTIRRGSGEEEDIDANQLNITVGKNHDPEEAVFNSVIDYVENDNKFDFSMQNLELTMNARFAEGEGYTDMVKVFTSAEFESIMGSINPVTRLSIASFDRVGATETKIIFSNIGSNDVDHSGDDENPKTDDAAGDDENPKTNDAADVFLLGSIALVAGLSLVLLKKRKLNP